MYDVIIIGSGPAGLTSAIYTTRANLKILVLAGQKWGGQLMLTTEIENYPGFPNGILGPELMQKFRDQAERFKAEIKDRDVTRVNFSKRPFKVWTDQDKYQGRAVIIATGADTRWLNVPGEQKLIGKGVSSCAPCDAFFFKDKKVIVVGGGDSAMEEALVLAKFASSVTVVHRRYEFRASKIMQNRLKENSKINLLLNAEVIEILGSQKVEKVKVRIKPSAKSLLLKSKEELEKISPKKLRLKILKVDNESITGEFPINGIFVAIGHIPNTKVFKSSGLKLDKKDYLERQGRKDEKTGLMKYWSATNIDGVFVAGDVHDYHYRQAVTAAGFGCMAAMDVERWLESDK